MHHLIYSLILCAAFAATAFPQCGALGALVFNPISGLLDCTAVPGVGLGSVTSVGLAGTANQVTVTGASPITSSGSWTLSFPTGGVTLPGITSIVDTVLGTDIVTPANPAAAHTKLYAKGGVWCSLSPAGVENCLGAGGGSAAAPLHAVQFNSPLGAFAGSASLTWELNDTGTMQIGTGNHGVADNNVQTDFGDIVFNQSAAHAAGGVQFYVQNTHVAHMTDHQIRLGTVYLDEIAGTKMQLSGNAFKANGYEMDGGVILGQDIATPAAPAASHTSLYPKGGTWCVEDPSSVETCVGAGGGSPGAPDDSLQYRVNGSTFGGSGMLYDFSAVSGFPLFQPAGPTSLNDVTFTGVYTDTTNPGAYFVVTLSTAGTPDKFTWQKCLSDTTCGAVSAEIDVTGADQLLSDGVSVHFVATTGHENNTSWLDQTGQLSLFAATNYFFGGSLMTPPVSGKVATILLGKDDNGYIAEMPQGTGALVNDGAGVLSWQSGGLVTVAFASLGTPANGFAYYCSDCKPTSGSDATAVASGTGCHVVRANGAWITGECN